VPSAITSGTRIAVVGASLGGLSVANVLRQLGARVEVFEAYPQGFHRRGGALGAVDVALLNRIRGSAAGPARPIRGHGHFYGDLWAYLYEGLPSESVHFGVRIDEIISADSDTPTLRLSGESRAFDLVIGADGGGSTIRPCVTDQAPSYAGYTVWRGLVSTEGVATGPSGRRAVGGVTYETLGFPCAGPDGGTMWNCGVYMATPQSEVAAPTRNRQVGKPMKQVPAWFVPLTTALFGERNGRFWEACARLGKVSPHPVWELAAQPVTRGRVALLGDAAHMASPRTGAGAYTAMVDAVVLGAVLSQASSLDEGLRLYNDDTVVRGAQLFERSRAAARAFAPTGRRIRSPQVLLRDLTGQAHLDFSNGGS
jgi:2-polyprenyl-6-methoxyphenol hydroxylase-like FAD-dependent oxidoreductase